MRFRTLALALALCCGFGTLAEAKKTPVSTSKAKKVKRPKTRKAPKRPLPKHVKHV